MSRRRRSLVRLPVVLVAGLLATSPTLAGADGATLAGFVATASAQDARITYSVLGFAAVEDVVDGGGTVAQAQLDGGGNSRSFAALPYPGDVAINGPGLFAFATGQQLPGGYPFFVAAETPLRPESKLDGPNGNYSLLAQAAPHRSLGSGQLLLGDGQNGARTNGEAVTEVTGDGTVRSVATSVTEGLSLGDGQLRIGTVRSSSVTTLAPGARQPTSESSLVVEGMTVGGTAVTVGPDGLHVGGSLLPAGPAGDALEPILAEAGVEVLVVEAQPLAGGERARSLEIRTIQTPPFPGFPPQQVVIILGGATTAVNVGESLPGALPAVPSGPEDAAGATPPAPEPTARPAPTQEPTPAALTPVTAPAGLPGEGAAGVTVGGGSALPAFPSGGPGATGTESVAAPSSPRPAGAGESQGALRQVTLARDLRHPITAFYLPLVVGAAVLLGGGFLWLTRGGRSA